MLASEFLFACTVAEDLAIAEGQLPSLCEASEHASSVPGRYVVVDEAVLKHNSGVSCRYQATSIRITRRTVGIKISGCCGVHLVVVVNLAVPQGHELVCVRPRHLFSVHMQPTADHHPAEAVPEDLAALHVQVPADNVNGSVANEFLVAACDGSGCSCRVRCAVDAAAVHFQLAPGTFTPHRDAAAREGSGIPRCNAVLGERSCWVARCGVQGAVVVVFRGQCEAD
mmetsp:Transcript_76496/g.127485  ORF Transcript_76496/g.127485 Transcript_76496/m.127485 type:complete len:226 (-) Transcript_76496:482-1159(-)